MTTSLTPGAAHPSLEDVAALIDGRLVEDRRKAVLAHVDACPACHEVLVETARVVESGDLGEELPASAEDAAERAPPRGGGAEVLRFPSVWRTGVVAATLAAAAAVAFLLLRTPLAVAPDHLPVATLAAELSPRAGGAVVGEAPEAWPAPRGERAALTGAERTAFQIGTLVLRADAALRGDRPDAAAALATDIALRLREFEVHEAFEPYFIGPDSVAEHAAAGRTDAALALLHEADALLGGDPELEAPGFLDSFWYALGKWAAAGELAAAAGDTSYFRSRAHRRYERALDPGELPEPVASDLRTVQGRLAELDGGRPSAALHEAFERLVASGGGRTAL